jgi:threonine dehydrogenase-like Zn-dependent dehydrogenase
VVVEPLLAGLCSSDLKEARRTREVRSDFGHEMVGVVHSGTADGLAPGLRVCLDPHVRVERTTGFGTAMLIAGEPGALRSALPPAPPSAPDERAVFLEPLACVAHCARNVQQGSTVAILGAGTSAALLSVLLRLDGCRVALINRGVARTEFLRATRLLSGTQLLTVADVHGGGFGTVVVTTALLDDATFALAWRLLPARGGRLVLFGGIPGDWRAPGSGLALDSVRRREDQLEFEHEGKRALVLGSHGPKRADFAAAAAVLDAPLPWTPSHVEELIVARLDLAGLLAEIVQAVGTGADPVGKRVITLSPAGRRMPRAPARARPGRPRRARA